jgi:SAM-dependent methyltransferase
VERANDPDGVKERWERYMLPKFFGWETFLDVGCWAGGFVREAVRRRKATHGIGIDAVPSPLWKDSPKEKYLIMDAFNPNFLGLPVCDIVLCAGVLYHVSDPVGLLRRLRMKTGKLLVLETATTNAYPFPYLRYCPADSFDNNPSNWFLPNVSFIHAISGEVGFEIIHTIRHGDRVCFHMKPIKTMTDKLLPRKKEYMRS